MLPLNSAGLGSRLSLFVADLPCFSLIGHFPKTHPLAEEAIRFQRDPQGVVGSRTDTQVAWTFPEIMATAEARLRILGEYMARLSQAGARMTAAL